MKLAALVEGEWGPPAAGGPSARVALPFVGGAGLHERAGGRGWVLDDRGSIGSLGAALVWAGRHQVKELHLLVDAPAGGVPTADGVGAVAGVLARRARLWAVPPRVWTVAGRGLVPAVPAPLPVPVEPPAAAREWMGVLSRHGAEVVVEGGVITGEVLGLEVARVVPDVGGPGWHVEVGVGRHDREATQELRPDEPLADALDRVVALVRGLRVAGAARGPANTLARERWLRSVLVARPELAGAARLEAVSPPVLRRDLVRPAPAAAAGFGLDGAGMVAVCSIGVDPDLVPTAADVRDVVERSGALVAPAGFAGPDGDAGSDGAAKSDGSDGSGSGPGGGGHKPRLVLVVPDGDDYPVTRELAAALAEPAEVVVVPRDWATLI